MDSLMEHPQIVRPRLFEAMVPVAAPVREEVGSWVGAAMDVVSEKPKVTMALGGMVLTYAVYRALKKPVAKRWTAFQHKIHGTVPFEGESMQEGSMIDGTGELEPPPSQVNLYSKGLFTTSFLGCGARVGTHLVTPFHVVKNEGTIIVEHPASGVRMELTARPIRSKSLMDMCYYQMSESWWSQLGARSAPTKTLPDTLAMRATPAVIVSRNQSSYGSVRPLPLVVYKVTYTGSTVPGFSGALYMDGNRVLGMHQGTSGMSNVGYLWEAIITDLAYISNDVGLQSCKGEKARADAGRGVYDKIQKAPEPSSSRMWGYGDVHSQIARAYTSDMGWAQDVEVDYDADLQFESSKSDAIMHDMCENLSSMSVAQMEVLAAKLEAEVKKKNLLGGQNETQSPVESEPTVFGAALTAAKETAKLLIEERVRPIEQRLSALEASPRERPAPVKPESTGKPGAKFSCKNCAKKFMTQMGLQQHMQMVVHGEKSRPSFLGKTKPPPLLSNSKKNSSILVETKASTSQAQSPPSVQSTLSRLESSLGDILAAIRGLKQEGEQK